MMKLEYDKQHLEKNRLIDEWLRYNASSAMIDYKIGKIDVFQYVRYYSRYGND